MNKKEVWATATFLVLYTGFIFAGFNWMLSAKIKAEIAPVKAEITTVKAEITTVKAEITTVKENQVRLEKRMDRMEARIGLEMQEIKSMLGQILIAQNIHHKGKASPANKFKKASKTKSTNRKTASH